jgi:hypothetical protein
MRLGHNLLGGFGQSVQPEIEIEAIPETVYQSEVIDKDGPKVNRLALASPFADTCP